MTKACYSDYANHCLRFYAHHNQPKFEKEVDEKNWTACDKVLNTYDDVEKNIILEIYSNSSPYLVEVVNSVSATMKLKPSRIWALIGDVTRKIARERGLL